MKDSENYFDSAIRSDVTELAAKCRDAGIPLIICYQLGDWIVGSTTASRGDRLVMEKIWQTTIAQPDAPCVRSTRLWLDEEKV